MHNQAIPLPSLLSSSYYPMFLVLDLLPLYTSRSYPSFLVLSLLLPHILLGRSCTSKYLPLTLVLFESYLFGFVLSQICFQFQVISFSDDDSAWINASIASWMVLMGDAEYLLYNSDTNNEFQPLKTGSIYSLSRIDTLFHKTSRRMNNVFTLKRPAHSHQVRLQNKIFYQNSPELEVRVMVKFKCGCKMNIVIMVICGYQTFQ